MQGGYLPRAGSQATWEMSGLVRRDQHEETPGIFPGSRQRSLPIFRDPAGVLMKGRPRPMVAMIFFGSTGQHDPTAAGNQGLSGHEG